VAIFKSQAAVLDQGGAVLGQGQAYLHLRLGLQRAQAASGTISLQSWEPVERAAATLRLADGRLLPLEVSREALSDCSRNRILRFTTTWPPL
jgi:hypothetical protein